MELVLMISSIVALCRVDYMKGDKFIYQFFLMVVIFIVSMLLIIIRPELIKILFGWDLLGLVSLVYQFIYYQRYRRYNSFMSFTFSKL